MFCYKNVYDLKRNDVIIGYFLQWILHDWSDEQCLKLLKNCYDATPNDGKVIVVEAVLPTMPEIGTCAKSTCQMDVLMMTQNPGGKERMEAEFMALATKAGFRGIRYETFVCNFWVMEFFKQIALLVLYTCKCIMCLLLTNMALFFRIVNPISLG